MILANYDFLYMLCSYFKSSIFVLFSIYC